MPSVNDSSTAPLLAILDEDRRSAHALSSTLEAAGYRCVSLSDEPQPDLQVESRGIRTVLLDLACPESKRMDAIALIRKASAVPILVVTSSASERDKVRALDAGADDYLTKPVATGELLARIRVALRHGLVRRDSHGARIVCGDLSVDLLARTVRVRGVPLSLTPTDYKLLALLTRNVGRVVTRELLLHEGWGPQVHDPHYLRVYMARLRRKLDPGRTGTQFISTEAGIGYRLLTKPRP